MIRPDLRDLINKHKSIERLNNNNNISNNNTGNTNNNNNSNNNNNNNNDNNDNDNNINNNNINNNNINNNNNNDNDAERGEWKTMLRMYIKCISTKSFNETHTMHPKSKQVEVYMGSDTEHVADTLFNTFLRTFRLIQGTSNQRGGKFIPDSVEILEHEFHKIGIIRAESYIITPD